MIRMEDKQFIKEHNKRFSINEYYEIFKQIYPKEKIQKFCQNNAIEYRRLDSSEKVKILNNKKQRIQTPINHDYFKVWSRNMAYILGLWFADGYIGTQNKGYQFGIKLQTADKALLQEILNEMGSKHRIYDKKDNSSEFIIGSKTIYRDIINLGGKEQKSMSLTFPIISDEYLSDFIRGYFDGDGTIFKDRFAYKILGTKEFLNGIAEILNKEGIEISNIKQHHKEFGENNNCYRLGIYKKNEAMKFANYIYKDIENALCLERKHKRYLLLKE